MELLLKLNYKQRNATRLCIIILGIFCYLLVNNSTIYSLILGAFLAMMWKNPTPLYTFAVTIRRDIVALYRFALLNIYIASMEFRKWSVARIFQEVAKKHPKKTCFIMDDHYWTFESVEEYTNKVGSYFRTLGFKRGDCVALLMETRPEYVGLWLGLSKIGITTALINSQLRRETLTHSIKAASSKAIIVGTELSTALEEILYDKEVAHLPIYQFVKYEQREKENFTFIKGAHDLCTSLQQQEVNDLSCDIEICRPKDKLLYVYTSGTTGLPKAAVITNLRYLFMATATFYMMALDVNDVIYNPLPLYHTAGGIVCVGTALIHGCTIAFRKKFSASNFWKDCIKYNCTAAQYIGELCRYLLLTPQRPEEKQHKLRLMFGNGLRPQIWTQFISRFNIPHIGEVYGSTEGNSNLANVTGKVGAVGFVPTMGRRFYPVQVIKCYEETGEPIRNNKGFCMRVGPGETGLLIGKVDHRRAVTAFNGYADKSASEKKLLRDVFKKGDCFFNSGDMIVGDILGYYYFKDRTGDTFRWRGENVATMEVEAIIANVIGLQDCVAYGVEIPHVEGKAGMAAIFDPERKVDLQHLSAGIRASLPPYAHPLFIRLMNEIPRTATFKMKKRDLVLEGYDINKISDPIYYLNRDGIYRPLTPKQLDEILKGHADTSVDYEIKNVASVEKDTTEMRAIAK